MAKIRSKPVKHTASVKKRNRKKFSLLQATRIIGLILITIVLLIAMVGILLRYSHILSRH